MPKIQEIYAGHKLLQKELDHGPEERSVFYIIERVENIRDAIMADLYFDDDRHVIESLRLMTKAQFAVRTNNPITFSIISDCIADLQSDQMYRD